MLSHVSMQPVPVDQLEKMRNTSLSSHHLQFATDRSTAVQHDAAMVLHTFLALRVRRAGR
jgi:hypothetical protein